MDSVDFPTRKPTRLPHYDYSQNGCYFVTVCVKSRKPILSRIVGGDDLGAPKEIRLKPYGKIAEKYIQSIETAYGCVKVENYIIMPNHIHLLILTDTYGAPRSSPPTLSAVIGAWKRLVNKEIGQNIWQRSFYDEIIKNETHYFRAWEYIEYNALKAYAENEKKEIKQKTKGI